MAPFLFSFFPFSPLISKVLEPICATLILNAVAPNLLIKHSPLAKHYEKLGIESKNNILNI